MDVGKTQGYTGCDCKKDVWDIVEGEEDDGKEE